ncbi:MAG: hypothetical protein ACK552_00215 [Microcystis sp.]
MDRDEIETTLKAAFLQCEALFCPLNQQQKEILALRYLLWFDRGA